MNRDAVILTITAAILSGCSSTGSMYAKYDEACDVPKVKIVEKPVEKIKIVEKPVETIKYVDKVVEKVKYVDKPVEKIKYVNKVKVVEKVKYVDKPVEKIKYVDRVQTKTVRGEAWEPAVYFAYDRSDLSGEERKRLADNVILLKRNSRLKLNVQAFTDDRGSMTYNDKLSERRMEAVINYLVVNGIARNRILASAMGKELPILSSSEYGRSVNRRVEMMLLDHAGRPLKLKMLPVSG